MGVSGGGGGVSTGVSGCVSRGDSGQKWVSVVLVVVVVSVMDVGSMIVLMLCYFVTTNNQPSTSHGACCLH